MTTGIATGRVAGATVRIVVGRRRRTMIAAAIMRIPPMESTVVSGLRREGRRESLTEGASVGRAAIPGRSLATSKTTVSSSGQTGRALSAT
jgi:hypothetical protein